MLRFLLVVLISVSVSGCSSKPEELIVGEWEFDHVEPLPANRNDASIQSMIGQVNNTFRGVTTEFLEDGSIISTYPNATDPIQGHYHFEDNSTTLVTAYETAPDANPSKILKLTSSELVLETNEFIYFMKK